MRLRLRRHIRNGVGSFGPLLVVLAVPLMGASPQSRSAVASRTGGTFRFESRSIGAEVSVAGNSQISFVVTDHVHGTVVRVADPFAVLLKDGTIYDSHTLIVAGEPVERVLSPRPEASRLADRLRGKELDIPLENPDHSLKMMWSVILLDDSSYIRQILAITAVDKDIPISRVQLIDLQVPGAHVSGSVQGSPIVTETLFLGFEHPLSQSKVTNGRATAWIDRDLPLRMGQSITYSSVIGVARAGQMRRDFLAYLEQERAHPYRTFLHYNSWYDLGYFTPYGEAGALDRVNAFGRELTEKRGVKLDSFLFDDGWDNHRSLWQFNDGFPNGFTAVRERAQRFGPAPGVWMSPWGGYSNPKKERLDFGKTAGYEIVANGYALSGPKYYSAFRDVCMKMVREYGVNQFKFDGTGNVDSVFPGSQFDSDFAAAINLIGELRTVKPDIYINLTTGTWPSPFWLVYADSIWRGGEDDGVAGVGTYRERWITYRDSQTYRRIVQNGPLFPLSSLMLHGMIYAQHRKQLETDPGDDFRNEVRSYFGTGTQLQEMYITPSLLSETNWDDLAEAAKWSRNNADVLKDTHWVGGDPAWLEVYGWASWRPGKGILVLRNPGDKEKSIPIKLQDVFELPVGAAQVYVAKSPWREDANREGVPLRADQVHEFRLAPFEVVILDVVAR